MRTIKTKQGETILVSDADFPLASRFRWYINDKGYPAATVRLHSLLFETGGKLCDHKDGDKLNNTRENLRAATQMQNRQNARKRRSITTSRFKGVSWHTRADRWRATIVVNKKQVHLRYHDTERQAARAYDRAAEKYFGEFACLNFPVVGSSGVV